MGLLRRERLPLAQVRELVELGAGERLLIAAQTASGTVVTTTHALWLPRGATLHRIGWEHVDEVTWSRDTSTLVVREAAPLGAQPHTWRLPMADDRDLLLVIKERVRATVITSARVPVGGSLGVTVVARRPPGQDRLTWAVSVDPGVDVDDPAVRSAVDDAIRAIRVDLGQ